MRSLQFIALFFSVVSAAPQAWSPISPANPVVTDSTKGLTYVGVYESGVEAFLGVHYGQDTGGQNRFKQPKPYVYKSGSTVTATTHGPSCPQATGDALFPIYLSNITEISEDCLLLNVRRPKDASKSSKLPVMVFIHGGTKHHISIFP